MLTKLLESYNVKWCKESLNSSESMPLGGGDVGVNVWVEDHDIFFYISRSGTIDENGQMLKLGLCRLRLNPNPFKHASEFVQELVLTQGIINITVKDDNNGLVKIKLWVEINQPIIHVDIDSESDLTVEAIFEAWRNSPRLVVDRDPCSTLIDYPGEVYTYEDIIDFDQDGVLFYHQNDNSKLMFDKEVRLQKLDNYRNEIYSPTQNLVFGGYLFGSGMAESGIVKDTYQGDPFKGWSLKSKTPTKKCNIDVHLHTSCVPNIEGWKAGLQKAIEQNKDKKGSWAFHQNWWSEFWGLSHIIINPNEVNSEDPVWQVGRNYQLFRFMLACNAYGKEPTKFNGGLFTFDPVYVNEKYHSETPDFRRWGGGTYTAQNQRLVYWPMLKSGDFEMMRPQFDFYLNALETAEMRTRVYWGHEGCSFTEQLNHTGLPTSREYGWNRPQGLDPGVEDNDFVNYEYVHQLDFAFMILQNYQYSGQDISTYMAFIESAVRFFDEHYQYRHLQQTGKKLDENGHLVIYPSTAVETFKNAKNPSDVIAGLMAVIKLMLELPEELANAGKKKGWLEILNRIPPISYEEKEGKRTIAPAESWSYVRNVEIPQLYPLFPFRIYGLGRPDLQTALNTWRFSVYHDQHKGYVSWHQGNIFTALLGLTEEAAEFAIKKLADGPHRFPAFWGPGHDWTPDHNWGGTGMIGLQEMLLQTNGKSIYLLPAWPDNWDVDFKLHAPYKTIIKGRYQNGKLEIIEISPKERLKDVVNMKE
jgi:hypothetical protein